MNRRVTIRPLLIAILLTSAAWVQLESSASAASIQVTTSLDENGAGAQCSLREAVIAANTDAAFGGCPSGGASGTDQITFAASTNGTPILLTNGEIQISSQIRIVGNGLSETRVDGQKGTGFATRIFHIVVGGNATFDTLTIQNGDIAGLGGGILNDDTLIVTNARLAGNKAANGGGISNSSGATLTVSTTTFDSNTTTSVGGGAIINQGLGSVSTSTFTANTAPINGGAVNVQGSGRFTLTNSTVTGSISGGLGGGISNLGTLEVIQSTLKGNTGSSGGGIATGNTNVTLRGSILANGTTGGNCDPTSSYSSGSNVADDATCFLNAGTDQVVADPKLGPLGNNGGLTQTFALLDGSPAIDAVKDTCATTFDQRGKPRPQGLRCDAGAFERQFGTLQFSSPTFTVPEAAGIATITVTRTGGNEGGVGATVSTGDGTAVAPADYATVSTIVNFADGDGANKTVNVPITNDILIEGNETVNLILTTPTGGAVLGAQTAAVLTILDDEAGPIASINDVTLNEGNSGTTAFIFTVSLNQPSLQQISVDVQTADGTAFAGSDYTALPLTTLTFAPGETSKSVTVLVTGETQLEPSETFTVNLSSAVNAGIGKAQGVGTITNDDGQAAISINDVSVIEGNAGTTNASFTVTLSQVFSQTVTVNAQTADGTAIAGSDYTALPLTTLTFAPGETSKSVTVLVTGDTQAESDETFTVNLSSAVNAGIGKAQGVGTITNDDGQTAISINDVSVIEGNAGTTNASFTVTLSQVFSQAVTVVVQTANGTASSPSDYSALSPTTITFNPGETSKTVVVTVIGDLIGEPDEDFFVNLSSPSNATIADSQGRGVIVNDDALDPGGDQPKERKETEEQRQHRERTNTSGKDDVSVEGSVMEVHQDEQPPFVMIANRDGLVKVILLCGDQCPTIRVGQYLEASGEKQNEFLFEASDVSIRR